MTKVEHIAIIDNRNILGNVPYESPQIMGIEGLNAT